MERLGMVAINVEKGHCLMDAAGTFLTLIA
jgi:hypothetical protein